MKDREYRCSRLGCSQERRSLDSSVDNSKVWPWLTAILYFRTMCSFTSMFNSHFWVGMHFLQKEGEAERDTVSLLNRTGREEGWRGTDVKALCLGKSS